MLPIVLNAKWFIMRKNKAVVIILSVLLNVREQ